MDINKVVLQSPFMQQMHERGAIHQCTNLLSLDKKMVEGKLCAFVGFDATADSLHIGHLVSLVAMRRLAQAGHRIIAVLGGATSRVGDPSFRNSTRPMLTSEQISHNMAGIRKNIEAVIGEHKDSLMVIDNAEWLNEATLIDFMRNIGVHFTISRMLSMESVKNRLEDGLSMLEFCYMMLQATDFLELNRRHGCILQMGGSDQWGNIINGVELARRSDSTELFGLTTPLLTNSCGEKMGKTSDGTVWLSPEKLSNFEFWQFWRNVRDADVANLARMLTDIPEDVIESTIAEDVNLAKSMLADWITTLVRGKDASLLAQKKAQALFNVSSSTVEPRDVKLEADDIGIMSLLVLAGFCSSNNEGRRLIEGGGIKIDGTLITDSKQRLCKGDLVRLSVGRRKRDFLKLI